MMKYKTPNIDRVANEGVFFTDYYGQQSCTAGRAAFINGSCPDRTGMTKVLLVHAGLRKVRVLFLSPLEVLLIFPPLD